MSNATWSGCPSIVIRVREADLAAVTENGAAAQVDFTHVIEISRRASEFPCAAFQVQRNGDDGEDSLGEWNSGGGSGVEKQGIAGIGDPVVLDVKDESVAWAILGSAEDGSADCASQVSGSGAQGGILIDAAEVGGDRAANQLATLRGDGLTQVSRSGVASGNGKICGEKNDQRNQKCDPRDRRNSHDGSCSSVDESPAGPTVATSARAWQEPIRWFIGSRASC